MCLSAEVMPCASFARTEKFTPLRAMETKERRWNWFSSAIQGETYLRRPAEMSTWPMT